jgi:hypothetical protein
MDADDFGTTPHPGSEADRRGPAAPLASADHRVRWTTPVTQPMLLCSQVQRSGGTLLVRLFDGHPSCFVHPNELRWGKQAGGLWPRLDLSSGPTADRLLEQLDEGWPKQFATAGYHKYSNWTHQHHPDQVHRYPFIFDADLQRRVFAAALAEHGCRTQRQALNLYLTSLFNAWLDYQNLYRVPKKWVTAFMPRLVMRERYLHRFFRDYPDGLFVTVVREPGSWLASFSRHVGRDDAGNLVDTWVASAEASVRAYETRPDRVVVLLFEDLVGRTEAVMRAMCRRMGIAFDPGLLEPTYNSMPVLSDSSHTLVTGIDPDVTTRHLSMLSAEQHDAVTSKAAVRYLEIRERFALPAAG